jgi:hypothetical protein
MRLAERLEGEGTFRILLSVDRDASTATLRFFERRSGERWGPDDPNALTLEDVLIIDTNV